MIAPDPQAKALQQMAAGIEDAMSSLIDANLVVVRRHDNWVEVEIKTDILFPSGVARLSPEAGPVFALLANALKPFPNQIRVEGHTDNRPDQDRRLSVELGALRRARGQRRAPAHQPGHGSTTAVGGGL